MAALTQLLNLTQLLRLSAAIDPNAPENTLVVELRTEDGVYVRTEDTKYVGVPN
jgi:hypothetical protein